MLEFLWDLYQQRQIGQIKDQATQAESGANKAQDRVLEMRHQIDSLILVTQALVEVLVAKGVTTEEALLAKVTEIDLRDGVKDGKIGVGTGLCPKCNRPFNGRLNKCLYCGYIGNSEMLVTKIR